MAATITEKRRQFGHQRSPSMEFKNMTKRDALVSLSIELQKLKKTSIFDETRNKAIDQDFEGFQKLFGKYLEADVSAPISWEKIEKLPTGSILPYLSLSEPKAKAEIKAMLDQLVVVKLNGGLGTSMGCSGPKSVIVVRNDLTFLDLSVQQIEYLNKTYDTDVPLLLMNSFYTDDETEKIRKKYGGFRVDIQTFNQSCFPRFNKESLLPIAKDLHVDKNPEAWYPPGHGDFYQAFYNSGLLEKLINQGKKYVFLSNIDNLGATVDLAILKEIIAQSSEFIMEVTDKTRADIKGGTLINYEGHLRLLEVAQVPKDHLEEFKSVKKFNVFNTNNLWISLESIKNAVEERTLDMEVIVNPKTLDNGINVIQLETAVGAAMKCFTKCKGINVPRSRFLPVKRTSDLLLIMSNLYKLQHGSLVMAPERMFQTTPLVNLGATNFRKVKDFLSRFASIPDILELDHLTVSGNVHFGKAVILKGTVIIIANHGEQIDIPSGAILENKIVSGNLRILDH